MHHHNRRIVLKYRCGLTQAKVANGLAGDIASGKRIPNTLKYRGDGQLIIDTLLLQDNPEVQLDVLALKINSLGGKAWISPTLNGYYKKAIKKHEIANTTMYRVVTRREAEYVTITAKKRTLLNPEDFNSPSIAIGTTLKAIPNGGEYTISYQGEEVTLRRDELLKRFLITSENTSDSNKWFVLHKGLNHHFPALSHQHKQRVKNKGITWLADFQEFSLVEGLINPYGYIGGWQQGSGKARYSLALALMHDGRSMVVVESGLLPEMIREIKKIGLDDSLWQVAKSGDRLDKKVNITTYATLRAGTRISYEITKKVRGEEKTRTVKKIIRTNAQKWRRQINTLICDEGGLLANINTQQTQAIKRLAANKLIPLDGTPQRNYPRDLMPLSVMAAGNGMAHQPYGVKGKPYVSKNLITTASQSQRGEDAFFNNHVVVQWVTNEFRDDMTAGERGEVPKINNLNLFREWLSPNMQRRLREEPDLSAFNNCPKPIKEIHKIDWDEGHLSHYLKVATEFANWYKQGSTSKAKNLVTVLARIGAVQRAANSPHVLSKSAMALYSETTSKQRHSVERIKYWVKQGRKVILYANNPKVLERLHAMHSEINIDSVLFTGEQDIDSRAKALDDEFRFGDSPVLLSSWVGQRGLNLEQAGVVLYYERNFSATTEGQALYRTQRPDQTQQVVAEFMHLAGSIDEYCAQLVEWKDKAADAGLDWGDQCEEEEEFLHLDTILSRFCDDVLNMSIHDAKEKMHA